MVSFFFEDADFDKSFLTGVDSWLLDIAKREGQTIASLIYIFCSDHYLLSINQQYLQHDYYTDIITFDQRDDLAEPIEGDIFISVDRVYENASIHRQSFQQELLRVVAHGILHLLGFDDINDELKLQMRCLEDKYLHLFNSTENW